MSLDQTNNLDSFGFISLTRMMASPYTESSFSSVTLNPSAVVDELRYAVVNKTPNILSSVDASQLKIYKNKTAFDGKEETVEDDCLISGLGLLSDKEALVVSPIARPSSLNQNENGDSGFSGLAFLMSHELDYHFIHPLSHKFENQSVYGIFCYQ